MLATRVLPLVLLMIPWLPACSKTAAPDTTPPVASAAEPASDASTTDPEPAPVLWIEPLPTLPLAELTNEQVARSVGCFDADDVRSPSTTPAQLIAAADCLAAIPAPGREIQLYRMLVETAPDAPEALEATRRLGTRFEQLDVRPRAVDAYESYLRRYPKQDDARLLGQRAVCLARSLGDGTRVDALLTELERLYGRRGFTRPSASALAQLCAPLPPLASRPGQPEP